MIFLVTGSLLLCPATESVRYVPVETLTRIRRRLKYHIDAAWSPRAAGAADGLRTGDGMEPRVAGLPFQRPGRRAAAATAHMTRRVRAGGLTLDSHAISWHKWPYISYIQPTKTGSTVGETGKARHAVVAGDLRDQIADG
jgi:hypothetical protein